MDDRQLSYHKMRLSSMRTWRKTFDSQWTEAARLVIPHDSPLFLGAGAQPTTPGQKRTEHQFDATPGLACQQFSAVMESLTAPQNSRWHFLTTLEKRLKRNRRVREYFEDVTDVLFKYRYSPRANFISNLQQVFMSQGAYGNGIMYVDQPDDVEGLRYRNVHLSECYFLENHARVVDTVYRVFWLTAQQAMQMFPRGLPDQIVQAAKDPKRTEEKFEFVHCVYPNPGYVPGMFGPQGKRYASLYFSTQPEAVLGVGGYQTFPYAVTRYTQATGEVYGRGPAQWVLPSLKLLNEQKRTVLKQGHRTVDPILLAHDDGTLDGFTMRSGYLNKGGVNKDGKLLVQGLPTGRVDVGDKMMEMERQIIRDAFLINLFQILIETPQMTATEVLERAREKGMLLAPMAGRLQSEFFGPMIERELDVLASQGLLPDMPPILEAAGAEYKIEYDSPMSRMQRAEGAAGFMRTLDTAANYAKMTGDPSPLDWFNFDEAMPDIADINGAPIRWVASPEQVAEKRDARAQAQQQEQMVNAAPGMAAMLKAAPNLAQGQQS